MPFWSGCHCGIFQHREYWEDGRQAPVCDVRAGDTCIHDLKRDPIVLLDKPYHVLFFYLPRAALNAIADDASAPRIGDLDCRLAAGVDDATIAGLGGTILPAFRRPSKPTGCLSTTSRSRSGFMPLKPMAACGRCRTRLGAGLRRGRSAAPRKFSAPTSTATCRSRTWRGSAVCR